MLARSARQASLSVGASADAETSATENRRKLTASESRPLTRPSPSALLVAGSRKFRGSQDAIGPPRHACCKSRNLAVGPGDEAVIQLCLFLRTAPSYFPSNSNARFPRRPSASAVASFVQPPPRRGSGAPTGALFLSSCRARARRDARACEARTCPGATGTPLGAPPCDFRPRTHAGVSGSGTPEPQRLPAPGRTAWRSGSGPPAVRFRAAVAGRDSWLRPQVVSGDVPS